MNRIIVFLMMFLVFRLSTMAQLEINTAGEKAKFARRNFEFSLSHNNSARQTQNVRITGAIIDKPELYRNVKKIAVLGLTVAFQSRDGWATGTDDGYAGISAAHFRELADSILKSVYAGFESEGFQVVTLENVMKLPAYKDISFGTPDESRRYNDNSFIATAAGSKWMEPDWVNSMRSGMKFIHMDTIKARAIKRNLPVQKLVAESGADAGVNIAVRFIIAGNEFNMGWGPLKRGLVIDMIPATGDPRVVWSVTVKSDVDLDTRVSTFNKKTDVWGNKSWKYNLSRSIPVLANITRGIFGAAAVQLKEDQAKKD
jgi:hypothetical protein